MAGSSKLTKPVAARLPVELVEWMATQPGSQAEVIARALIALRDGVTGPGPDQRPVVLQGLVAQLEAENARLTTERDQWRDRAKAIVDAKAGVPVPRVDAVATKTIGHHAAGPILEPRLNVQGTARPFFRPGTNADKAAKSG
jgi:hypothetical protein